MSTSSHVRRLEDAQLQRFRNVALAETVRNFVIEPWSEERPWDYGPPGTKYLCWIVVDPPHLNVGINYCESGFGPECPWGLIGLTNGDPGMGPDSSWFATLEAAAEDLFGEVPSSSNYPLERP